MKTNLLGGLLIASTLGMTPMMASADSGTLMSDGQLDQIVAGRPSDVGYGAFTGEQASSLRNTYTLYYVSNAVRALGAPVPGDEPFVGRCTAGTADIDCPPIEP